VAHSKRGILPLERWRPSYPLYLSHLSTIESVKGEVAAHLSTLGSPFLSKWCTLPPLGAPSSLGDLLLLYNKALSHCKASWSLGIVPLYCYCIILFIGIKKGFGGYIGVYFHVWSFYVQCLIVRYNLLMCISCF
jgi:hypothetical protein